jgi:hypothetical protein
MAKAAKKRTLIRLAVPLEKVPNLTAKQAAILRTHWINTAQELIGIAQSEAGREALTNALGLDDEQLDELIEGATRIVPRMHSRRLLTAAMAAEGTTYTTGSMPPTGPEIAAARAHKPYVTVAYPLELPPSLDYRDGLPAIRSQGERGTCVAFASVAVREHLEGLAGAPLDELDLSEQFVYWYCKQEDNIPEVSGTYTNMGMECMLELGVPEEQYWPYNPDQLPDDEGQGPPPPEALDQTASYKIERVIDLNPSQVQDLKTCLAEGKTIAFAIPVFDSWYFSTAVKRYGKITMPLPGEKANGGHAMALVGYQDDEEVPGGGYFLVRNSWQPWGYQSTWGSGYGSIPYAYIEDHCYAALSADRFTEADVYIRDNESDDGKVPSKGSFWNSPDIWVRNSPDALPAHQNPIPGRSNYLYLQLHNRGPAAAYNVRAHVYTCPLSPSIWPRNWSLLQTLKVPALRPGTVLIGPLRWQPKNSLLSCYLVRLESDNDPIQHDWSVQWDNNIAQKNLAVMDLAPGEEGELRFIMHGVWGKLTRLSLDVERVNLPAGTELQVHTASRRFEKGFEADGVIVERSGMRSVAHIVSSQVSLEDLEVRSSEEARVTAKIILSRDAKPGERYEVVFVQRLGPLVVGKLTCLIHVQDVKDPEP